MSLFARSKFLGVAAAVSATALVSGCAEHAGSGGGAEAASSCPEEVTVLVHTGPGGGADVLAREVVAMLEKEEIVEPGSWTVENREGGDGAVVLNYMREQAGRDDLVMFTSVVHLVNELATEGVDVGTLDMTPIVSLYDDRMAIAVKADGPYDSLEDFINAAKERPGELVQSGGSTTSFDAMVGNILQAESGAEWQFLSFESGGDRQTALLRGDSQLYMTEPADMRENVEAGDMDVVAVVGDEPSAIFPDAPTTSDLGFESEMPTSTRGVVGPPEMPQEAVICFEETFTELTNSPTWKEFVERTDVDPVFRGSEDYQQALEDARTRYVDLFRESGQLVSE